MEFLLDESVSKASLVRLRMLGYDVVRVGTDVRIALDADILREATKTGRVLVTLDQDFGELVFKRGMGSRSGIVLFRYDPDDPEEVAKRIHSLVASGLIDFAGHLTAVDAVKVRQRKI